MGNSSELNHPSKPSTVLHIMKNIALFLALSFCICASAFADNTEASGKLEIISAKPGEIILIATGLNTDNGKQLTVQFSEDLKTWTDTAGPAQVLEGSTPTRLNLRIMLQMELKPRMFFRVQTKR